MNTLALRKQLLVAESEVNRVQLANDWQGLTDEFQHLSHHAQSLCGSVASLASVGIAGVNAFKELRGRHKKSWFANILSGVRVGAAMFQTFRSRG
jgi:hypothetical protein